MIQLPERTCAEKQEFISPIVGAGRAGYTRALALLQLGDYQEALEWFAYGRGLSFGPTLLAPSHYYRGQIHEELGDIEQAIWHYEAFAVLWKDADAELQPRVREVLEHVAELRGETIVVTTGD